jgi:hypothetical protein
VKRALDVLLSTGLLLGLIGSIGQLVVMILDLFLLPSLRWYWGGSLAFFAAPVAFALTLRLLEQRPIREPHNA